LLRLEFETTMSYDILLPDYVRHSELRTSAPLQSEQTGMREGDQGDQSNSVPKGLVVSCLYVASPVSGTLIS
jgi:hypothetical protein